MKRSTVVALAVVAGLVVVPSVLADPPEIVQLPPAQDFGDTFCGFLVLYDFEEAQPGSVASFFDDSGGLARQIATFPGLNVVITNFETGESIAHTLSGQGIKEFHPDGSTTLTASGGWGIWPRMGGVRGRFLTFGHVLEVRGPSGDLVSRTLQGGRLIDVCAELAP